MPNTENIKMPADLMIQNPPTHSGVERVGENENANYPIPTTKYQYQLPDTQYPNAQYREHQIAKISDDPKYQNTWL